MDVSFEKAEHRKQLATLTVETGEAVCVLHPNQIVAFQGGAAQREDSFMNLPGMYRKKRFVQSRIHGPAQFMRDFLRVIILGLFLLKRMMTCSISSGMCCFIK
jgi:hypothetical protein